MKKSHNSKSIKIPWHHRFKRDLLPSKKSFGISQLIDASARCQKIPHQLPLACAKVNLKSNLFM